MTAMLTDMKRRAKEQGVSKSDIVKLQKIAVEETIKGLDINPVLLQLAAAQLTAGNQYIHYSHMGLQLMAYGPQDDGQILAGSLELLSQKKILPRPEEFQNLKDNQIKAKAFWGSASIE